MELFGLNPQVQTADLSYRVTPLNWEMAGRLLMRLAFPRLARRATSLTIMELLKEAQAMTNAHLEIATARFDFPLGP
jgi:hypothetical protein